MSSTVNLTDSFLKKHSLGQAAANRTDRDSNDSTLARRSLEKPLQDFLSRKGKRIRADLIEISFQLCGGLGKPPSEIVEFVELLHAGSLIIDDIQDNSRNRRQRETLHLTYGVPVAINTGNWLYFAALELLTQLDVPAERSLAIMKKVLRVIKQCHEGQALDLTATFDQVTPDQIPETVREISRLKTGALTSLAAWLGAVVAGADHADCERLSRFGTQLGIGLQMQNDFVELQKVAVSRCNSDDLRNRRCTWPWAWLAEAYPAADVTRLAKLACDQAPEQQHCAQQVLERIEIVAANEINEKLENSLDELSNLKIDSKIKNKLNTMIATLELHYA
jgi:geranylgeranyl pyrophosphate synthase